MRHNVCSTFLVLSLALAALPALAAPACPSAGFTLVQPKASAATRPVKTAQGATLFVDRQAITTTDDITEIKLAGDDFDALVLIKFAPAAAARLHDATTNRSGLHIAFVADKMALSAITWQGAYGMDADVGMQLSLRNGKRRAAPVVSAIQACLSSRAR